MSIRRTYRMQPRRTRERPVTLDPTAVYDVQWRKLPKKIGFIELARGVPALFAEFTGEVPAGRVVWQEGQAIFDCACGEVIYANENTITDCVCKRSFVPIGGRVLVRKEEMAVED
jgi:hypothetical protein